MLELAVVEQSSVAVDGQPQNDSRSEDANASKEAILEILPEVSADDDFIVDQLKQHAPVCKANDVVSEVLPEGNDRNNIESSVDIASQISNQQKTIPNTSLLAEDLDDSDEIELIKNQNIELDLIRDLRNENDQNHVISTEDLIFTQYRGNTEILPNNATHISNSPGPGDLPKTE
ncbi:9543_t:CDS:2, partial [Dentiscutata erythropus]